MDGPCVVWADLRECRACSYDNKHLLFPLVDNPATLPDAEGKVEMTTSGQREAFGRELERVRTSMSMTQAELAAALPEDVRVTPAAIGQWERGEQTPPAKRVFAVEDVLGVEPGRLAVLLGYDRRATEWSIPDQIEGLRAEIRQVRELLERLVPRNGRDNGR